jgi:hypothetical protein
MPGLPPLTGLPTETTFTLQQPATSGELLKERDDRENHKVRQQFDGEWGSLQSQIQVREGRSAVTWEEPLWARTWKTDENWKYTVGGPVFLFGQLGANSDEAAQKNMKVAGRTGLACKLPVGSAGEVTIRSGPGVTYTDPLRPTWMREHPDWLVEVQARWPLLLGIGLEYQGSAAPALTPLDRDWINHDLYVAIPVGAAGKVKLGAKRRWENTIDPHPNPDNTQLYLGLELAR